MADPLIFEDAFDLVRWIRRGSLSPVELLQACLDRIHRRNSTLNAFIDLFEEEALQQARTAEEEVRSGKPPGPLHGIPIAIKDNIAVAGKRFTHGCAALQDNTAERDDPVVSRLRDAGAVLIGKTNLPEFATKGVTDNPLFGPTGNPFDPDRMSGGSSGGSAAAVADGMVPLALATDGGGSARIPASACGVFGMKATFGRIPVPLRPDGFSHHTPMRGRGPQARTVEDGALMMKVMAGTDSADPFSVPGPDWDPVDAVRESISGMKIAYSEDLNVFAVDPRVREVFADAVEALDRSEAHLSEDHPDFPDDRRTMLECWATGFHVILAEVTQNLKDAGVDLLGEYRDRIEPTNVEAAETGLDLGAVEYRRNDTTRTRVFDAVQEFFETYDLLLTPTLAVPPFEHGIWGPDSIEGESIDSQFGWCLTWLFNLTGHPAASVPAGWTERGLPVGMQVVGPRFADDRVLAACGTFERLKPWRDAYERLL